jgi:hypothetical protein
MEKPYVIILVVLGFLVGGYEGYNRHAAKEPRECFSLSYREQMRSDTFLIDKCRGRVWQMTQHTYLEGDPLAWDEMPVIDSQGRIGITPSEFESLFKKKQK